MYTEKYHNIIDRYLERFSDAEKLTEFYEVVLIAHKALMEIDMLNDILDRN